jgi:hypothetical protein
VVKGGSLRTGILKAVTSADEKYCNSHGECTKLFSSTDISSMNTGKRNYQLAMQAESTMQKAREIAERVEARVLLGHRLSKLLGNMDVDVVLYIFKKLPKDQSAASMAAIGARFYRSLAEALGPLSERLDANPWAGAESSSSSSTVARKGALPSNITQLDSKGEVVDYSNLLASAGISKDTVLEKMIDGLRFLVLDVSPNEVQLQSDADKRRRVVVHASAVLENYKVATCIPIVVSGKELAQMCPSMNEEIQWELAASYVKIALCQLEQDEKMLGAGVCVTLSPLVARTVIAERDFPKHALLFPASSMNVQRKVESKTYPDNAIHLGKIKTTFSSRAFDAMLMPSKITVDVKDATARRLVPPFWFVKSTIHQEVSNCSIVSKEVDVNGMKVAAPVMQTRKAIRAGDELLEFRPKRP